MAGEDFNETFAPVAKFITIRDILTLGATIDWEIHQINVNMENLNEILEIAIYLYQPNHTKREKKHCMQHRIFLYMLKQLSRAWYSITACSSLTIIFVGAKPIICCTSNKHEYRSQ